MAFDIYSIKGEPISDRIKAFCADSTSDVSILPTQTKRGTSADGQVFEENTVASGSTCIIKTGEVYMLFPDGTWAEI